ncbi:MAG: ABC transporter permease subunit [Thermoplasmatales archaeon]
MKPVYYDIKRSLTNRFSIIMIIVIIGLTALISYEGGAISTSHATRGSGVNEVSGYYAEGDNLTLISYFYDSTGNPVNVKVNATLNGMVYQGTEISPGLFEFHMTGSSSSKIVNLNYSYREFGFSANRVAYININTKLSNYSGLTVATGIVEPANSSNLGFILFYVGSAGNHTSPPLKVYLAALNTANGSFSGNNYTFIGQFSGFTYRTVFPDLGSNAIGKNYELIVENATGALIYKYPIGPLSNFTPFTASSVESSFFSSEGTILTLFIPLLAVFMGYFTYGKDRVNGVLESVLKRPITRGEAIRSRFLANSVAIVASIIAAILISDVIGHRYFHIYMPLSFLIYVWWSYSIVGISFLAISYFFAHIIKSQGALLGSLIGIFMVFSLFWNVIFDVLVSVFSITSGTSTYIRFQVAFDYASPAGYASLVQLYLTHSFGGISSLFGGSQAINPLTYGVTPSLLFIAGILWVAIPFAIAHYIAVKRD